jgi:hypothetical protein
MISIVLPRSNRIDRSARPNLDILTESLGFGWNRICKRSDLYSGKFN